MAYGFSVFWIPLSRSIGISKATACPADMSLVAELFAGTCDWKVASLGWMYTLFFVFLGISAAMFGGWVERAGPRKAGVAAAVLWCGGLVLGAIGVIGHQLWLLWLGSGVIGGLGLGLGYISPVSTLVKWFPDRRGMATGMAIMGFGGGAMIGAPLANLLMNYFKTPTDVGVWQTFLAMGAIYFLFMLIGAFRYRIPPAGWRPQGWTPPAKSNAMISQHNVHLKDAHKTTQFWLIWWVLCLNVSAGIGVIGWVVTTWMRIKHGYPLDGAWGQAVYPKKNEEVVERMKLVSQENAQLRAELGSVKDRLANVERIVTDDSHRLTQEIEALRSPRN